MKTGLYSFLIFMVLGTNGYGQHGSPKIDKRVAVLIEKMVHQKTEQRAFTELESLGCPAVPAIIERMDDKRKLPDPRISLRNKSPDAFEGPDITARRGLSMLSRPS